MSPHVTRRRYLQFGTAGLVAGVAGCSSSTVENEGEPGGYDVFLRHDFEYDPPSGDSLDVRVRIEVSELTDEGAVDGETVFERSLELPAEHTEKRFTDAFSRTDDTVEWVATAEMEALIGDEPIVVHGNVVDAPDTTSSDTYRFRPGDDRGPKNNVVVVSTDEDTSRDNGTTIEKVSVGGQ